MKIARIHYAVLGTLTVIWLGVILPHIKQTLFLEPIAFPRQSINHLESNILITISFLLIFYSFLLGKKLLINSSNNSIQREFSSKPNKKKLALAFIISLSILAPFVDAYIYQQQNQNITLTILDLFSNFYHYVTNDASNIDNNLDEGSSTNFNAQKNGPDSISDEIIEEYIIAEDFEDYVDISNSNVDGSQDIGTHSNFNAQQSGPDSTLDILTEQNTVSNTHSLDATGGYILVGDGTTDWGSTSGTISFWVQWDTVANRPWGQHENMETRISGTNLVVDWGAAGSLTSTTSFTAGNWYFIAITWNEATDTLSMYVGDPSTSPILDAQNTVWTGAVSTVGVTQNNFMAAKSGVNPLDGHGDDLRYYDTDRSLAEAQSDYNTELTGSETGLRSYFKLNNDFDDIGPDNNDGSGVGSYAFSTDTPFGGGGPTETIRVDVWYNSAWNNVFTDLSDGWNNVTVVSYLDSSTFTIRFKGGTETSDTTQDSWKIDASLLHLWG